MNTFASFLVTWLVLCILHLACKFKRPPILHVVVMDSITNDVDYHDRLEFLVE